MARDTHGDLLLIQGKPIEALKEYRHVRELDPNHFQIEEKIKRAETVRQELENLLKEKCLNHHIRRIVCRHKFFFLVLSSTLGGIY